MSKKIRQLKRRQRELLAKDEMTLEEQCEYKDLDYKIAIEREMIEVKEDCREGWKND